MRWMAHWDAQAGYYLGFEDPACGDFGFGQFASPVPGRFTLSSELTSHVKPGDKWTSPVFRHAAIGPDWHEGADLYRVPPAEKPDVQPQPFRRSLHSLTFPGEPSRVTACAETILSNCSLLISPASITSSRTLLPCCRACAAICVAFS